MRVVLRKILTLLLCISLMPGWMEIIENLEHLVHDGHLAHLVAHDDDEDTADHDAIEAEHGCTPVSHTCTCHTSIPVLLPPRLDLSNPPTVVLRMRPPIRNEHPLHRANAPPIPPPQA